MHLEIAQRAKELLSEKGIPYLVSKTTVEYNHIDNQQSYTVHALSADGNPEATGSGLSIADAVNDLITSIEKHQ